MRLSHGFSALLLVVAAAAAVSLTIGGSAFAQHGAMPGGVAPAPAPRPMVEDPSSFAVNVDLEPLGRLAVHADGRINSFGSSARSHMNFISGPRLILGQSSVFSYLDLMFRPDAYRDVPMIYVKNKPMRAQIASALRRSLQEHGPAALMSGQAGGQPHSRMPMLEATLENDLAAFERSGLISRVKLLDPFVQQTLAGLKQDLVRTAKFVNEIEGAMGASAPETLRRSLRLIPPPTGGFDQQWLTFSDLVSSTASASHALAPLSPELRRSLLDEWRNLEAGWQSLDSARVNAATARLAELLPQVNPELYPGEGSRAGWPWSIESLESIGAAWMASVVISVLLLVIFLIGVILGWSTIGSLGALGTVATILFHGSTLYLGTQNPLPLETWYFASYNMTWVWILYALTLVPLLLTVVFRWEPARWIGLAMFILAFGLHTAALLIRWYVSDRWPNSNMFEAVTTAAWFGGCGAVILELCVRRLPMRGFFALGSASASMVALMATYYLPAYLDPNIRNMMPVLHDVWLYIHTNVIIFSYCLIFMAAVSATLYLLYRMAGSVGGFGGAGDYARVGGAGSLIQVTPDGQSYIEKVRSNLGQVLDGTTMILMELSFVLLWTGLVMGAIWADHSWGRPWGWDPKEVFALNTFLVFAVLIHVRLKTRDKGFWTAVIALIGAGVMLFNWIAINFVVTGLHSYA